MSILFFTSINHKIIGDKYTESLLMLKLEIVFNGEKHSFRNTSRMQNIEFIG